MIALVLVAASVGLSNFAASIGIGIGGVDGRVRCASAWSSACSRRACRSWACSSASAWKAIWAGRPAGSAPPC